MKKFNIYCDESCHLENDHQQVMILGAIWCSEDSSRSIAKRIKAIKAKHNLNPSFEIKWTKVSRREKLRKEFESFMGQKKEGSAV